MTLTVLRCTGHLLSRMSLCWDLLDAFLMISLGRWVFRRRTTEISPCSSHHIKGTYYQLDLSLWMWTLIWLWWWLSDFSTVMLLLPPLFIMRSLSGGHHAQSALKKWGVNALFPWGQSVYIDYLEFFCTTDLFLLPDLIMYLMYSFIWSIKCEFMGS